MTSPALLGQIALFAVIGTAEDFIVSCYYRALAERRAGRTAAISFFHTLLAVFVIGSCINAASPWPLLAYAAGGAVGSYLGVRRK